MIDPNKVKALYEKVRKLLAMANDPSVGAEMAANYAAGAQKLLETYNLDLRDMPEDEASEAAPIGSFTWAPKYADRGWRKMVAASAARVYMCHILTTRVWDPNYGSHGNYRPGYVLVGRKHSIDVCKSMIEYLFATGFRLSRGYTDVERDRREFEKGYGARMSRRLDEMYHASAKPAAGSSNPGNLPALYASELDLAKRYVDEEFNVKKARGLRNDVRDWSHASAGVEAANNVSLGAQVASPTGGALLIGN